MDELEGVGVGHDVRFGSKADICSAKRHVRSTPDSGHVRCNLGCPLCANNGHQLCSDASISRATGIAHHRCRQFDKELNANSRNLMMRSITSRALLVGAVLLAAPPAIEPALAQSGQWNSTHRLFRIDLRQPTATRARRRPIVPAATASVWPRQSAIAAAAAPNEPAAIEPPRLRQRTDAAAAAAGRSSRATTSARSGAARGGRRSWTNADRLAAGPGVAA